MVGTRLEYENYGWPNEEKSMILPSFYRVYGSKIRKNVIDLGCGTGWITAELNAEYVLGIDRDKYLLDIAKRENAKENVDYKIIDFCDIGNINKRFDLAVSTLSMHMLGTKENILDFLVSMPSNELLTVVPHPNSIDKKENYSKYIFSDSFNYHEGGRYNVWLDNGTSVANFRAKHVSMQAYMNAIVGSGFEIIEFEELGGKRFPYFLLMYLEKKGERKWF
jgi:SAM-dependent methyltransferase